MKWIIDYFKNADSFLITAILALFGALLWFIKDWKARMESDIKAKVAKEVCDVKHAERHKDDTDN